MSKHAQTPLTGSLAIVFEQIKDLTNLNLLLSTKELVAELQRNHRLGSDFEITPFGLAGQIDKLEALGLIGAAVKQVAEGDQEIMVFYELTQGKRLEQEGIVSEPYSFPAEEVVAEQRKLLGLSPDSLTGTGNWINSLERE